MIDTRKQFIKPHLSYNYFIGLICQNKSIFATLYASAIIKLICINCEVNY